MGDLAAEGVKTKLLNDLESRRSLLSEFAARKERSGGAYTNTSIVCGAITTFLTGGSALGRVLMSTPVGGTSGHWDGLSIAGIVAAVTSCIATVSTALYKKNKIEALVQTARKWAAKLELLYIRFEHNKITDTDVIKELGSCLIETNFIDAPTKEGIEATIDEPASNQEVPSFFPCSGTVRGWNKTTHLWLVVEEIESSSAEVDAPRGFWPKDGEIIPSSGRWSAKIHELGASHRFSIGLYVSNGRAHKRMQKWLDDSNEQADWPPLKNRRGMKRLDMKSLHRPSK